MSVIRGLIESYRMRIPRRLGINMWDMCQFRVEETVDGDRILLWDSHGFRTFGARHPMDWDFVCYL